MLRGLLWKGEIDYFFEFGGSHSISGATTGFAYSHGGQLTTFYCPNYIDFIEGMHLLGARGKGPSDPSELTYIEFESATLGLSWSGSDGSWSSDCTARFDIELYQENTGQTRLVIHSIKIINGSTTLHTFSSISDIYSTIPGPFGIPIIGIPPLFESKPLVGPAPVTGGDYSMSPSWSISYSNTAVGGWKFRPSGSSSWYTVPLTIGSTASDIIEPTGASTGDVSVSTTIEYVGSSTSSSNIESCYCWVWPSGNKEFVKSSTDITGSDYEAVWLRYGFPHTERFTYTAVGKPFDLAPPGDPPTWVETRTYDEILQAQSQFLERATNTSHFIEDTVLQSVDVPFGQNRNYLVWTNNLQSTVQDGKSVEYPSDVSGSGCANYVYGHDNFLAKLFGTWFNPFWSVGPWFPSDDASDSVRWPVNGSPAGIDDYWLPNGQQWVYHPALPSEDNTKHRVSVITETLSQNGLRDACGTWIGLPSFLGISRPEVYGESIPDSVSTNSSSHFTFSGSGVVGSSISVISGSVVTCDWISYDNHPYGFPAVCDRIQIGWDTSNISSLKTYVVGVDGTEWLVSDNVQGTFRINQSSSAKWGSSMGHDFGGSIMSDTYSNGESDDYSSTIIGSSSTHTFELLAGRAPHKLKFVVTKINPGLPATIYHPTFYKGSNSKTFHSVRRHSETLYENGPAIRYLPGGFFDYFADSIVSEFLPETGINLAPTVGDALTFANWCWKGKDAQDSLSTLLGNYFTYNEEWAVAKDAWREPDGFGLVSHSFTVMSSGGPSLWMVNSYREVPPLCAFPVAKRDFNNSWSKKEEFGQYVYTFINAKHPLSTPGPTRPQLFKDSDISSLTTAPSGWSVSLYNLSTNNDEGYDYDLYKEKSWLKMRPWRGNFNVFGQGRKESQPHILQQGIGSMHRVCITDTVTGDIVYRRADNTIPLPAFSSSITYAASGASWPKIEQDIVNRRVYVPFLRGQKLVYVYSDDDGLTFSPETVVSNVANYHSIAQNQRGDMLLAWVNSASGVIQMQRKFRGDDQFSPTFLPTDGTNPIKTNSFDLKAGRDLQNRWWFTTNTGSSMHTWWSSDDGDTWTQFGTKFIGTGHEVRMDVSQLGELARAWRNSDSTLTSQVFGEVDWGPATPITDSVNNIKVGTNGWGDFSWAYDHQHRLTMSILAESDSLISDWYSCDDGRTWTRVIP